MQNFFGWVKGRWIYNVYLASRHLLPGPVLNMNQTSKSFRPGELKSLSRSINGCETSMSSASYLPWPSNASSLSAREIFPGYVIVIDFMHTAASQLHDVCMHAFVRKLLFHITWPFVLSVAHIVMKSMTSLKSSLHLTDVTVFVFSFFFLKCILLWYASQRNKRQKLKFNLTISLRFFNLIKTLQRR